jgi:integrase
MAERRLLRKTILVVKSKNGEKRTIPMNQKVFELLKAKARANQNGNKIVFPSEAGTENLRRNLMRSFYNARNRAKIADLHFHDLRHTFAT